MVKCETCQEMSYYYIVEIDQDDETAWTEIEGYCCSCGEEVDLISRGLSAGK